MRYPYFRIWHSDGWLLQRSGAPRRFYNLQSVNAEIAALRKEAVPGTVIRCVQFSEGGSATMVCEFVTPERKRPVPLVALGRLGDSAGYVGPIGHA